MGALSHVGARGRPSPAVGFIDESHQGRILIMTTQHGSIALALCLGLAGMAEAREAKLLRQPTYHDGKVAFSYLGDIWTAREDGSNVVRLTANKARDLSPRFSPDGKTIAFSSDRE